jgi:hypothetical protein
MEKRFVKKWLSWGSSCLLGIAMLVGVSINIRGDLCPGGLVQGCHAAAVLVDPPTKVQPRSLKGIYMTAETAASSYGKGLVAKLVNSGGNAVVINIQHDGGLLAFTPKNPVLKKMNPGSGKLNDLQFWVRDLQSQGIYVIARQVVFNQPYMASKNPEWRIHDKRGGYYPEKWLDPSLPEVQNYNLYVLREIAEMGFDEVQFDYIRFPATNHRNYNYAFDQKKFTPSDIIVDFLEKAKDVAGQYNMALGVDVFGVTVWGDVDWRVLGQDLGRIAKTVDVIYPMTYPSHFANGFHGHPDTNNAPYSIVYDSIARFIAKSDGGAEIRPWIQGFPLKVNHFGTWFVQEQVQAAFDAGVDDFMVWSPGNRYAYSWPVFATQPKDAPYLIPMP